MIEVLWQDFTYYLYYERKLDRKNDSSYRYIFGVITKFFSERDFDVNNVNHFFAEQQARGMSNSSLNNYLKLLKHVARYLHLDFLDNYTYFRKIQATIRLLTTDEVRRLELCYIERGHNCDSIKINEKYATLIHILAVTGMRIGEALSLKWDCVMPDRITVKAEYSKTDSMRQIPITESTYKILYKLDKNEYVFGNTRGPMDKGTFNTELKKRAKLLKFKDWNLIHAHQFRHYAATEWLKAGNPIQLVARCLGHSADTCDKYYTHYIINDLRTVVESSPLTIQEMSYEKVVERVEKLATTIQNTKYPLHLQKNKTNIILEVLNI